MNWKYNKNDFVYDEYCQFSYETVQMFQIIF